MAVELLDLLREVDPGRKHRLLIHAAGGHIGRLVVAAQAHAGNVQRRVGKLDGVDNVRGVSVGGIFRAVELETPRQYDPARLAAGDKPPLQHTPHQSAAKPSHKRHANMKGGLPERIGRFVPGPIQGPPIR